MKIIIQNKEDYNKDFIYNYLPQYLLTSINNYYSPSRALQISRELHLNILDIFKYALSNLIIAETGDSYTISINKNLRYNKYNLKKLIDFINYGNMKVKGYRLLYDIFEAAAKNIDLIYKEWQDGNTLLR